ncbi:hypothetical protein OIO90_000282 [Microbotryomycetes sp. JL221]|nr:hypothetical protein OIO90_000282 [Microbotryomycetes sp. JL221]
MALPGSFANQDSGGNYSDDEDDLAPGNFASSSASQRAPLLPLPVTSTVAPFSTTPRSHSIGHTHLASKRKQPTSTYSDGDGHAFGTGAIDDDEDEDGSTTRPGPAGMSFCVRFTDGSEDLLDIWVGEKESVGQVKRRIRLLRPALVVDVPYTVQLLSKRAKLVQSAAKPNSQALLEGLEAVGREIGVNVTGSNDKVNGKRLEGDHKGKGKETQTVADGDERVWLQCSVGEPMDDEEIAGEQDKVQQTAQITPLQGLDRLRDAGFSEEDISSMRAEFRRTHASNLEGDDDEHARALEDQWMEGLTGQNEAAAAADGLSDSYWTTLLQGVCIGFFVPFLPFFFFRTQVFSRGMSIAIVLGAFINLVFGLLRMFN